MPSLPRLVTAAPWLAATVFPLNVWYMRFEEAPPAIDVLSTFLLTWIACGFVAGTIRLLLGPARTQDAARSVIIAFIAVSALGAYGHVHYLLIPYGIPHKAAFPAFLLIAAASVAATRHVSSSTNQSVLKVCAFTSVVLLAYNASMIAWGLARVATQTIVPKFAVGFPVPPSERPDICLIVTDGYARSDMLKQYCGFSNSAFEDALALRGFEIRGRANANYSQTRLSLASTLNLAYLKMSQGDRLQPWSKHVLWSKCRDSQLADILRSQGYRYRYLSSSFGAMERSATADEMVRATPMPAYLRQFVQTTAMQIPLRMFGYNLDETTENIDSQLQELRAAGQAAAPTFTLVHLMLPHPPFRFGRRDEEVIFPDDNKRYPPLVMEAYVSQIEYLNRRLLALIDAWPADRPQIVVIQSDHGGGMLGQPYQEVPSQEQIDERLAVFSAIRAPETLRPHLRSVSSVNVFRVILREVLGASLEDLPDKSYYYNDRGLIEIQ